VGGERERRKSRKARSQQQRGGQNKGTIQVVRRTQNGEQAEPSDRKMKRSEPASDEEKSWGVGSSGEQELASKREPKRAARCLDKIRPFSCQRKTRKLG